jgi:hypothetical protein
MFGSVWLVWWLFMLFFLMAPMGYGWGYRGWGPPYPSYVQRRRAERSTAVAGSFDHYSWSWGGDLLWMGLFFAVMWAASTFWWR